MARCSLLTRPHLDAIPLADATAPELVRRTCQGVAAPADHTLVIDPRWVAISASTLERLIQLGVGATLRSQGGAPVAWVSGRDDLPPQVDSFEAAGLGRAPTSLDLPPDEDHPLDDPAEADRAERAWMATRLAELAASGVRVIRPERIWIGAEVQVAPGATLWPDLTLRGQTRIEAGAEVQAGCWVEDSVVGARSVLRPHNVITGARIGADCAVGPMAHLREGAVLMDEVKVGNFVEVKKTTLHKGAKASHLTYLGDAEIGAEANIGAGTITCNYDGYGKHRTTIGAGAFIGSNTALVAPVTVAERAIVGAGSVIAEDIPADALALERAPLTLMEGKAPGLRQKNQARAQAAKRASDG